MMRFRVCLSLLLSLAGLVQSECPAGWIIRGDYCYHFHDITYSTSGMSWNESRLACQRYGGDLVVIRNNSEQSFLASSMTQSQKRQHYWIGLSDYAKEGQFVWIDGTSLAATGSHWRSSTGEPNNWGGNEDCAELHDDGLWNDNWCERPFAFICQKDKNTPIPTALTLPPRPSSTKYCKLTITGTSYSGTLNTTKSGFTCQRWDSQTPHEHKTNLPKDIPSLENNYCRNPDQEPDGPWCYTTNPRKRWDYCDVKLCMRGPIICEAGWYGFNNSCYLFQKEGRTWTEARADCQRRGADLVVVDSSAEHNFLTDRIKRDNAGFWIGLTDKYIEGVFYWVNGKKLEANVSFWGANEPSNAFGGEDCVEMWTWWHSGRWNDNRCAINRNYICEKISGSSMCPEDWITFDGMCYQLNAHPEQKKTWLEANQACKSFPGANLVSIHNSIVSRKIVQSFKSVFVNNGHFWLGLNDIKKEGQFEWSDQSKYVYANWGFNEQRKNNDDLDCVKGELRTPTGLWSLANCNSTSERNYYVCGRVREYDRCHNPLGMESFGIGNNQITASSEKSATTPASSGRKNAARGFGLDGAWCAAANDKNQWLRIDMGEFYSVKFIGLQGHPNTNSYVKTFYLKYSPDGWRWSIYGYNPPTSPYKTLSGNSVSDKSLGYTAELKPPIKARFVEIHPVSWSNAICMRVEVYGCPAVSDNLECGPGWINNTALNTCYKIGTTALPWTAARANCLLDNGDLVSITSYSEYTFLRYLLNPMKRKVYSFWIGLNSRDSRNVFRWSDGSALTTVQWLSGNPVTYRYNTGAMSCVALRPYYSSWFNMFCSNEKPYICKRKLKKSADLKDKFTGNWISGTDYYWPLDDSVHDIIAGTRTGSFYGSVGFATAVNGRQAIKFEGASSYGLIPVLAQTCVSDPSRCTNGVTYSMLLNLPASLASTGGQKLFLLDIMGQGQSDAAGFYVYVNNGQLGIFFRSVYHTWHSIISPVLDKWFHLSFVWNEQSGLVVYVNGERRVNDNSGTRTSTNILNDRIQDLYIGKSALSGSTTTTNFSLTSLAVWKRSLTADEIKAIYVYEMGGCQASWLPFGQDCFQFNTNRTIYVNAKRDCESKGGKLAVIPTSLQQAFLSMGVYTIKSDSYIGLNSMKRRRFFEWVDATPVTFSYWYQRRPSSYSWRRYDAVVMSSSSHGRWSDVSYYYSRSYICQRRKEIIPASQVQYYNRSATTRQYSTMTYGCPLGTKLEITSAYFGKPPACAYRDVLPKVQAQCANKTTSCLFYVTTSALGNFCAGTRKEFQTNYICNLDADVSNTGGCDAQWKSSQYSNYCYKLNQAKVNWTDADAYCKSKGANLVSIQSKTEEILLTSLLINSYELMNIWIGYNDLAVRGKYVWTDNARATYTNWFNGQPDDGARRGSCVKASMNQGYRDFLTWSDDDCSTLNSFICKKLKASMTTSAPPMTRINNSSCLPGWLRYKSNCYQFSSRNATWMDASRACLEQRSFLATINSLDENEAAFDFLINSTLESAWIGLHDRGIFAGQQWSDGSPVSFVRWDSGQPDSNLGQQACVIMASNGFWRDNDCNARRPYICKASVGIATIVPTTKALTVPVTPTSNLKYCPKNWVWSSITGNCYLFSNRTYFASWTDARSYCRSLNGDLASIVSSAEQSYLEPFLLTFSSKSAWIGLSDLGVESGWEWSDGKPTTYFNWKSGQPDDWSQMEDCVQMRTGGQWDDRNCGEKASFICKRANNSVVIPNTVAPTAGPLRGYCEPGWVHYRSKCYKLTTNDLLSWTGARNVCRSEMVGKKHGDLVSIHSSYENAFLFSQMKTIYTKLFIGFNDIKTEGKFQWSDQSNVDFTRWYSRQPDNYWNREDCVEIWPFATHKGRWNDVDCSDEMGYICQKDASSTPPSVAPTTASSNYCPNGFVMYGNNCYSFKKEMKTWDEAVEICRRENTNSDLVSVHDAYEAAYVFSHMGEYTNRIWLGLHRPKNESKFRWSNNQPFDYSEWSSYPARRMLHLRSCVYSFYNTRLSGFWVDSNCTARMPFVCKIARSEPNIVPEHPGTCPKNWVKFDKYCYLIRNSYYGTRHWSQARQQCLDLGADLASIHSREEHSFLYTEASKGQQSSWIGLNDRRIEKHMVWSDGTPLDFSNWAAKEPNDNSGHENCVEMTFLSGRWNDNRCSSYRGYICKKELGCDASFGMENGTILDNQIMASSVASNYFAQYARLNSRNGWCAGTIDTNQYIQVDLGEVKRLTRIVTQGFSRNYVLSYRVFFSDDGDSWKVYKIEGREAILPANRASYTTEGVTLKTPVIARFIRIQPLTWKNSICMKLEFYGCSYVCYQPLGMESGAIRNYEVNGSSAIAPNMPYDARFRKPNGQGWCAKDQNAMQWLQIHFSSNPVTITRVATQGVIVDGKNNAVKSYRLSYSDDGKSWIPYKTLKGAVRIFSGNSYPETGVFHTLSRPFIARYVRFEPLAWDGNICMRVEIFGCPYDCDRPFGISSSKIPDKAITASTSFDEHLPSAGRLNKGSFNKGSWCAKTNDQRQYLQFNLGAESRITAVATQGLEGDISKYVTDYWIQFSHDGLFWSLYHDSGVIQTINGNVDGSTVKKVKLPSPIRAKYIRLNPRHWKQGICMRAELYGCALQPVTYPTDAPIPKKRFLTGKLRLSEEKYIKEYSNKDSEQFRNMANKIETAITALYQGDYSFKDGFYGVEVIDLKPGSVIATFILIFKTNDANVTMLLKDAISKGKLGDIAVDKKSLELSNTDNSGTPGKSTQIVKKEGLSDGGKAALIVIFLLMIFGIIAAGVWYYLKKRGKSQFDHKSFDNPVHFTSEVYSATGERVDNLPSQH